jgi:hypothetical protein
MANHDSPGASRIARLCRWGHLAARSNAPALIELHEELLPMLDARSGQTSRHMDEIEAELDRLKRNGNRHRQLADFAACTTACTKS